MAQITDSKFIGNGVIEDADVNASANIARSKLAPGSGNHVVINDGSGVMSSEAQLAISRGGTGQTTATAAFDALAPTTTKGDLIAYNGTDNVRVAAGTDGYILVADSVQSSGLIWSPGPAVADFIVNNFSGTGSQTNFTLTDDPGSENNLQVYVEGVYQQKNTFSVSGTTLTFTEAPPTGTNNIEVMIGRSNFISTPATGSVTKSKFSTNALNKTVTNVTGTYTALETDEVLICSGASFTLSLPSAAAAGMSGKEYTIIHTGTSLSQIYTIDAFGSQTIDGDLTYPLYTNGESLKIMSDGSNWIEINHYAQTNWQSAGTITIGATTTAPSKASGIAIDRLMWRRDGKDLLGRIEYRQTNSTSALAGSGDYLFTAVPSGITIDSSLVTFYTGVEGAGAYVSDNMVGSASARGTVPANGWASVYSSTQIRGFLISSGAEGVISSGYVAINDTTTQYYLFDYRVPITEWKP